MAKETTRILATRRLGRTGRFVLSLGLLACTTSAQTGTPIGQPAPPTHGQWSGPWDLSATMVNDEVSGLPYVPSIAEIAHAHVLPPSSPAEAEASEYGGKVLFITQRGGDFTTNAAQPTFVWDPGAPSVVESPHVFVPNDSTTDIFCSGVTFLGDGTALTAGGRDRFNGNFMYGNPTGISKSFRLRTDLATTPGSLSWESVLTETLIRYYPTTITLWDGSAMTFGHTGHPNEDDLPPNIWGAARYRETFDLGMGSWQAALRNLTLGQSPPCYDDVDAIPLSLEDYPKVHMLGSHELMHVDGEYRDMVSGDRFIMSRFLTLDETLPEDCPASTDPYRWRDGEPIDDLVGGAPVPPHQAGGNSVHLITRKDDVQTERHEVVYAIAGTEHGSDDQNCPDTVTSNRVFWMEDPSETVEWSGGGPIASSWNLGASRTNCNTVILLDGSLLVVGGADVEPGTGNCIDRTTPELCRPPQVFESLSQPTWKDMAVQTGKRRYHSVAGLLPDGSVFSAGGTDFDYRHTAEIYRPPYFFRGPRPKLVSPPTQLAGGAQPILTVGLRGAGPNPTFRRVALLRNTSVTHAFDSNQRYVEVPVSGLVTIVGNQANIPIEIPADDYELPPGWYLLTVVFDMDSGAVPSSDNLPSRGHWVFISQ